MISVDWSNSLSESDFSEAVTISAALTKPGQITAHTDLMHCNGSCQYAAAACFITGLG